MGFANTVIGGAAALIRAAIKSPNYVAGSLGWSVNKDGSAEFNSLTVRGTFQGTDYVINPNGVFFYSPNEAAGNLAVAVAPVATTGPFGESVGQGVTVGLASASSQIRLIPGQPAHSSQVMFADPTGALSNNPNLAAGPLGAVTQMLLSGPALGTAGHKDWVQLMLVSSDGTNEAVLNFVYVSNAGTAFIMGSYNGTGWTFNTPVSITAGLTVTGGASIDALSLGTPLSVSGTSATGALTDGTINGSSQQVGLPNGGIQGTSGGASAGTAHTHGPGSFSVTNGQHTHGPGSYAVTNGTHSHGAGSYGAS